MSLAIAIEGLPLLEELSLDHHVIGDDGGPSLAHALRGKTHLTALCLTDNEIGDEAVDFQQCFNTTPRVEKLRLGGNRFHPRHCVYELTGLRELALGLADVSAQAFGSFLDNLSKLRGLTSLELGLQCLPSDLADLLGPAIGCCTQLRHLEVIPVLHPYGEEVRLCAHLTPLSSLTRLGVANEEVIPLAQFLATSHGARKPPLGQFHVRRGRAHGRVRVSGRAARIHVPYRSELSHE